MQGLHPECTDIYLPTTTMGFSYTLENFDPFTNAKLDTFYTNAHGTVWTSIFYLL